MRALAANCTMIAFSLASTFASLSSAQAQQFGVQPEVRPNPMRVQAAQFDEIVPAPAAELDIAPEISDAIGEVVADSNNQIFDTPPPSDSVATDLMPPSPEPAPIMESPAFNEPIIDTTFDAGQPYDIPIADVIPQEDAEVYSTNKWFRGGTWYSRQEFMMLLRADLTPTHLAVDNSLQVNRFTGVDQALDPFTTNALSSQDGSPTYESGTRLSLGKIIGRDVANRDHSIEFVFSGLFEHTGRAAIEPISAFSINNGQAIPVGIETLLGSVETRADPFRSPSGGFVSVNPIQGFTNSTRQEFLFESTLNSFEMNYVIGGRPARDRLVMQPDGRWTRFATPSKVRGFFAGLRYIRMNESLRVQAFGNNQVIAEFSEDEDGNITETDGVPDQIGNRIFVVDENGTYRVNTDNDLFGVQFGGDVVAKRTDWTFGITGKFAGLLNFADRQSILLQRLEGTRPVTNNPNEDSPFTTTTTREALDDETLTVLGELNAYVSYYLKPNTAIRVGYNVLYMNGVAAAMDNSGFIGGTFPKFELTGDAFYHGMNAGFETTW